MRYCVWMDCVVCAGGRGASFSLLDRAPSHHTHPSTHAGTHTSFDPHQMTHTHTGVCYEESPPPPPLEKPLEQPALQHASATGGGLVLTDCAHVDVLHTAANLSPPCFTRSSRVGSRWVVGVYPEAKEEVLFMRFIKVTAAAMTAASLVSRKTGSAEGEGRERIVPALFAYTASPRSRLTDASSSGEGGKSRESRGQLVSAQQRRAIHSVEDIVTVQLDN